MTNRAARRVYYGGMDVIDDELVPRLAAGESEAFARLYRAYGASLYRYLVSATGQPETAEDLLQAVWLRLVRYRGRLLGVSNLRAYLFRIARNEVRRGAGAAPRFLPPEALAGLRSTGGREEGPGDADALRTVLARLPPERREVVALKAWHGLTFAEIGDVLAISPNTAASRYRLALADLAHWLEETTDAAR